MTFDQFAKRYLTNEKKRRPSPSMYNETGFYNWFGGFHLNQDRVAYLGLLLLLLKKPWNPAYRKLSTRYLWRRWVHRRCDTTDFHHEIYCMLDPWVRKRDAEYRYVKIWEPYYAAQKERDTLQNQASTSM